VTNQNTQYLIYRFLVKRLEVVGLSTYYWRCNQEIIGNPLKRYELMFY
jgi:hypothetical protein